MIKSTDAYKQAIVADSRRIMLKATVDISDPNLSYGDVSASPQLKYSDTSDLLDKTFDLPKYATLEPGRLKLDGSYSLYDAEPQKQEEYGFVSEAMCGADGVFATPQTITVNFSGVKVLQACSVHFSKNPLDGVPKNLTISVYQGGVKRFTGVFADNEASSVYADGFTVNNADKVVIEVESMTIPFRRLRVAEIIVGIYEEWSGNEMSTFSLKQQGDVSNTALPYGTCEIIMDNISRRFEPRNKAGIFKSITERQNIGVFMGAMLPDGSTEYKPVGVYYQHGDGWKTSNNDITMSWNLIDIVGLLSEREYIAPDILPTTLDGWARSIVGQLGKAFENRYTVDPAYKDTAVTVDSAEQISGLSCGDMIRYVAMASGTWARADSETGYLTFEPLWNEGNKITLDNLTNYPTMKANRDIAAIIFDIGKEKIVISGNSTAASNTISINNPFLHTKEDAIKASRLILSTVGGNQIEINGRGDMASEIGDVDTVWLDESQATTARRIAQDFSLSDGVLQNVASTLLQADGYEVFTSRALFTADGTFKAPAGVSKLRVILVGHGRDGQDGTDGTWSSAGKDGADGLGGNVYAETIDINPGQEFPVAIGESTTFGPLSSDNGTVFPYGYTDIQSGESYARTGVKKPLPGFGDGGKGGNGGAQGHMHTETFSDSFGGSHSKTVIDSRPKPGEPGSTGGSGCVVIYWNKPEVI